MRPRPGRRRLWLAAALSAIAAACARHVPPISAPIVVAMANAPTSLDPGVALDEASQKLQQLIFSSLLKVDDHLRVVPDLATRFEAADPQTYVAEIPPHVQFHDGREMTAEDVAYTFRRFLDPAFVSGRKGAYRGLSSVEVLGRYRVAFHLAKPSASFPVNLVMSIVPVGTGAEAQRHPIGSGPYRVAEFAADDHVTLRPFDRYYAGPPRNAGLIFRIVPDETTRALELRKGTVDLVINDLSPDTVSALGRDPHLQVVTGAGTDYAYIGFNLRDRVLRDVRVRRAIGYAVDVEAITQFLRRGLAQPAASVIPPMSWAFDPTIFRFTHDPAKAKALLDEAGYPDPDGDGPLPRLHLTLKTSTVEFYRLQAAVIQQDLAQVGIALDVRSYEFSTLMSDVLSGNVQLYTLQWVGVTDPDMLRRAFHSTQMPPNGFNRGRYVNEEVDRLIDEATAADTEAARARFYEAAERQIAEDAPYIGLWTRINAVVAQRDLAGIALTPTADFTFLSQVRRVGS